MILSYCRLWVLALLVLLMSSHLPPGQASTAAFCGQVIEVADCKGDCLRKFAVKIDYFDYVSWGRFGRASRLGETITRQVRTTGTACLINGRLVNARTFAKAIRPGTWGYFYEDTWLDLYTTPNFRWGEIVAYHQSQQQFTLRVHGTHKQIHLETNPPQQVSVSYDTQTDFRIEESGSTPEEALVIGSWAQVHDPREQLIAVWSSQAAFQPEELLPVEEGRRGYANRLTQTAILRGFQSNNPSGVLDVRVTLQAQLSGRSGSPQQIGARSVSFVLDGKLCPVHVAVRPGRQAVLCYYRKEKSPHKVMVNSYDDAVRGRISRRGDGEMTVDLKRADGLKKTIKLHPNARYQLNGLPTSAHEALQPGRDVVVYPKRGRTVIVFPIVTNNER